MGQRRRLAVRVLRSGGARSGAAVPPLAGLAIAAVLAPGLWCATLANADSWNPVTPLPLARAYLAAAAPSGGTIYFLGGLSGTAFCSNNEAYDAVADVWWSRSAMRTPRAGFVAAAPLGGTVYAVGGNDTPSSQGLRLNEAYDPVRDAWSVQAPMPTPRRYAASACVGGMMYVLGGVISGTVTGANEAYDPIANVWTARARMPTPRFLFAAVAVGGKIYAIGGVTALLGGISGGNVSLIYLDTVEVYDPGSDSWTTAAPMPTPRGGLGAADPGNGMIYAAGGLDATGSLNVCERYNPGVDAWYPRAPLGAPASPPATGRHGLVVISPPLTGSLFAAGGTWIPQTPPGSRYDATGLWSGSGTLYAANEKYTPDPALLLSRLVVVPPAVEVGVSATVYQVVVNAGDITATLTTPSLEVVGGIGGVTAPVTPFTGTGYTGSIRPGESVQYLWPVTALAVAQVVFSGTVAGTDASSGAPVSVSSTNYAPLVCAYPVRLASSLTLAPLPLGAGGRLVVSLTVSNTGGGTSYLTSAQLTTWQGAGLLSLVAGPVPSGTVVIGPVSSTVFTWTYSVSGAGYVLMTASATGSDELFGVFSTGATRSTSPTAVRNLKAGQGDAAAHLTWDANPAFEQVSAYQVYRARSPGVAPGPGTLVGAVPGTGLTDTGLLDGVTYYYVLIAVNADGAGPVSAEVSVMPLVLPGTPGDVRVVPFGSRRLAIDPAHGEYDEILLNVPAGDGTVTVTVYTLLAERVREVFSGPAGPGLLILTWDGRNDKGRPVASGGYLLIVNFPDGRRVTRKLAVVK